MLHLVGYFPVSARGSRELLAPFHEDFHGLPCARRPALVKAELKPTSSAAGPLIEAPIDAGAGQGAEQKRADPAVSDDQNVAILRARKARIYLPHDPVLCMFCGLPSPHTPGGVSEECIGHFLKFFLRQIPGRAAIIFVHQRANLQFDSQSRSKRSGGFKRFCFIAADHSACPRQASKLSGQSGGPDAAKFVKRPSGHVFHRLDKNLRVRKIADDQGH